MSSRWRLQLSGKRTCHHRKAGVVRVLWVPSYTKSTSLAGPASSDAICYGVTSASALADGLRACGCKVDVLPILNVCGHTSWLAECLKQFQRAVKTNRYDAILSFHSFWPFAADLRRILDDSGVHPVFVGYTHGSHWDPSDLFRHDNYPSLRWADLGNLLSLDRILVVSDWMQATLSRNIRLACESAANAVDARMRAVGLPIDLARIDAARRQPDNVPLVIFNHSLTRSKRPEIFLKVANELMDATSACVMITRRVSPESALATRIAHLSRSFPGRFILGGDLTIDNYFAALWRSRVQISTATHESLGVATLEAMATRTHCLLPRCGAYPEIVGGDPNVLYTSEEELPGRLVAAIDDTVQHDQVVTRLYQRARARYSPTAIAVKVFEVLKEAIDERQRAVLCNETSSATAIE